MDLTKIDNLNKQLQEMKEKFRTEAQNTLSEVFKEFFENNPEVTAVGWRQYIPYFNDGEPCEFRSYAEYAWATNTKDYSSIDYGEYNGEDDEESIWIDDPDYGCLNEELIPEQVDQEMKEVREFLSKIPEEIYQDMFGDHVKVYVTRSGVEVVEYTDHD